jgi:RHS repeat-associated protein
VESAVHNWTHGTWGPFGFAIAVDGVSVTDSNAYKLFKAWDACGGGGCTPHIDITWNAAPSTPALSSPGNGDTAHKLRPTLSAVSSDSNGDTIYYQYEVCGLIYGTNQCLGSGRLANGTSWQVPDGWLAANQTYTWRAHSDDGLVNGGWSGTRTFTPTNTTPTTPTLRSPVGADAVVGTSTLSFTADSTDGNGDAVKYLFQVATGSDGQTGRIATSTWQSTTTWSPPPGTFADGGTYYWTARAQDAWGATTGWQSAQQVRIDFRLGRRDTMPYDSLGPATVNLSNGNLLLSVDGPSFPTVGGPVGVSFSYNSQTPVVHGMVGDYYQDLDADGTVDNGEPNLLHRIDPSLDFNWNAGDGPNPGVIKPDRWIGHWSGAIRVPAGGGWGEDDYVFVSDRSDDSVTLRTGGPTGPVVLSAPGCCQYVTGQSTVRLSPTSGTNLDLVFTQATGPAALRLKIRKASAPAGSEIAIPSDWLFATQPALPDGWSRSADSPVPDAYTSVRPVTGTTTAVVDEAGTDHLFTWTGTSWAPPAGEDGVLTQNADSTWSLSADDGYLYTFRSDGRVTSIVSAADDIRPGAPTYAYQPLADGVVRLRTVTDAAGRAITFSYAPSTECPIPPVGFDTVAPTDMLCKVSYGGFDCTDTRLYYSGGHLARVVNPGGATVDFGYDAAGLLVSVRDVLTNDLIAGGIITDGTSDTHKTLIGYTAGRVTSVKGPVADAGTTEGQRPLHTYGWTVNATTKLVTRATVDVAGLSGGAGQPADARVVDLDSGGHATRDTDAAGISVDTVWDNLNDRPNRVTDGHYQTSPAGGLVTTTKYDAAGRVTDTYGPALAGEFAVDGTSATAPRAHTNYDEGITGLAAAWYGTADLTGAPRAHTTSSLNHGWGAGSPAGAVPADNFSGRLTGEVTVPGTNPATLTLNADGGRIYVDGALASGDTWGGPYRAAVRADNPVNLWRLGDATGSATAADSAGFNPGTYNGGVTRGVAGALAADGDKAAAFDGAGGYVGASGLDGAFAGNFAVEALVKFDAVNRGGDNAILGHGIAQPNQGLHVGERAGKAYFGFYGNDLAGTAQLQPNTWYHLAFVYDGSQRIYVNGVLDAQRATGAYNGSGGAVRIGSYPWWGVYLDGVLDEVAVYRSAPSAARVTAHANARSATTATATATVPAGTHRLRVDYQELVGDAGLTLTSGVAGTTFAPRYNLATSHKDADGRWTRTEYATPEVGLATATVVDPVIPTVNPNGLDLRSTTAYEPASATTFFRRTSRTLPKGAATSVSYTHYGITETADNPCPGGATGINQAGAVKSETNADPDGAGPQSPIVREYRRDAAGRVVARRVVGDAAWTCASYDDRGRVTSRTDSSGKTTTYLYAIADRVTELATGSDGVTRTTVSRVDWLGRTVAYTDELGTVTRRTYDQLDRLTGVYRTFSGQDEATVQTSAYDSVGRLASTTEHLSGGPRTTTFGYNAAGQATTVTRPNGVVTTTGYDSARRWVSTLSNTRSGTELSHWTYGHSPSGDVVSEVADTLGRTRTFGYDGAGRLTSVGGTTTRNYAWDANSNRCAEATTCATPTYTYDDADRLLTSPYATGHTYDAHGNLTSAAPSTVPPPGSLDESFAMDPATPWSRGIVVGQAGTVSTNLDWSAAGSPYTTQTESGSLAASATRMTTVPVDGVSYVGAPLTWTQATRTRTDALSGTVTSGSPQGKTLSVTATGTVSISADWSSSKVDTSTWQGTVADLGRQDHPITVSANGPIEAMVYWPSATRNLDLEILDSSGTVVASSTELTGNREPNSATHLTYNVTGLGAYPATRTYILRVRAVGLGSSYTLQARWWATADVDLELWKGGTRVAQATGTSAKPETLSYNVAAGNTGDYTYKVYSKDHATTLSGSATYPTLVYADLSLNLKNPAGTTVASGRSSSGSITVSYPANSGGNYALEIVNNSADLDVPSFSLPWSTTMQGTDTWSGTDVPAATMRTHPVVVDGQGRITTDLTWTQGTRTRTDTLSGLLGGPASRILAVTGTGTVSVATDWSPSTTSDTWPGGTVADLGQQDHTITVSANGTISASVSWPSAVPNPNLDLEILDSSGTVVASSAQLTGNREPASGSLTYNVTGMGSYPATRTYTLRVKAVGKGSSYNLAGTWPVTADVDLELWKGSTKVAQATGTSSKPETLTYNVTSGNTGNYTLTVRSKDHDASFTGSASYPTLAHANVTLRVRRPDGTSMGSSGASGGTLNLHNDATAAGTYTVEITNNSTDLSMPSFTATSRVPRTHLATVLQLKNAAGQVVAENVSNDKPKSLTTIVQPGRYTLVVSTTGGTATGTLTGSYPGRPARMAITYDANDHATSVDDGTVKVTETLSPSGRVLRRVVTDSATGDVSEDTDFGYDGPGDSPAYSRPHGGGTVTTHLGDVVYTGTTASWQLVNLHGDVVGTTDAAGAFTAAPPTDEFGVGQAPADRLGWLGGKDRFNVGGGLGLIRMGVRLYDTRTGRFLAVDPVEGGTPNDYVYPTDPVNEFDLDGTRCWTGKNPNGTCRSISRGAGRTTRAAGRGVVAGAGAVVRTGVAVGGVVVRNRGTLATFGASAGCAFPGVGWGLCVGLQAAASGVRMQQRGVTHYRSNAADALITWGGIAAVQAPLRMATAGSPLLQRAVTAGATSPTGAWFATCQRWPGSDLC